MCEQSRVVALQLPINFHKTFVPERRLIAALLGYAAAEKAGTYAEIAAQTGIPMGKSSGKVPVIIDYARGMGLIDLMPCEDRALKKPILTPFGEVVFREDRFLGRVITQWLVHLNLCLPATGASAWYKTFAEGRTSLGSSFSAQQLEDYLVSFFGPGRNRTGPLLRTYLDDAALGRASVLHRNGNTVIREKAPLLDEFSFAYAAYLLSLIEAYFSGEFQVTVSDLNEKTHCFDACLWGERDIADALTLAEKTGLIGVDRQLRPWMIEMRADASKAWGRMYE